jgi:hypothetical protein
LRPACAASCLGDAQLAELRIDLLGRLLADVAGVEDHQIRVVDIGRLDEAFRRQRVHHALGIVDVHLAAVGFDMQLTRRGHGTCNGLEMRLLRSAQL